MTTNAPAPAAETKQTPATKVVKQCGCLVGTGKECDRTTQKAFAQGHDARLASRLAQAVAAGELTAEAAQKLIEQAGGSDLLIGKMKHSAELRKNKASAPRTPRAPKAPKDAAEKADTPEARAAQSPGNPLLGTKVKVRHNEKEYDAVVLKDSHDRVIARHRLIGNNCDHEVSPDGTPGAKIK